MPSCGYVINPKSGTSTLLSQLSQTLDLSKEPQHRFSRDYLDSFDWRLLNKGYCLQAAHHDNAVLLQLVRLRDLELITQLHSAKLPRFVDELEPSRLATLLRPMLDVRALLPQISTTVTQQCLHQLNTQDKITATLCVEQIKPHTDRRALKLLLHNVVKGYETDNKRVSKYLQDESLLEATRQSTLQLLLSRLDMDTSYNGKADLRLDGAARSDAQIKRLLAFFLEVMRRNEDGIIQDIDSEFLHDYRIAVRRSRTLLGQVPGIMPQRTVERTKAQLSRLGRITTPLRDLDVMLLNFDDYRELLPDTLQADLDPALTFIREQRQGAYQNLRRHLSSKSHTRFHRRWRDFLGSPGPANTRLANAKRPLQQVANQRIWKNYKKVLQQGRAITDASPPEDLHTLRKSCKKLRYLMEFFRTLYARKKLKQLIAILRRLQDNLGEYQDIHVHIDFFAHLRRDMQDQGRLPEATAVALDKVIAGLNIQQRTQRQGFHQRFDEFSRATNRKSFKALFKP